MFKISKVLLVGLWIAQCGSVSAGAGNYGDFKAAAVVFGLGCTAVGGVATLGLVQSYKWAKNSTGAKKYIGMGMLTTAGIATIFGLGYGIAKLK